MYKKKIFLGIKHSLCGLFIATLTFNSLSVKADPVKVTGICNIGSSCFMNSAIQALHSNNTFVRFVRAIATKFVIEDVKNEKDESKDKVSVILVKLFDYLDKEDEVLQGKDENQKKLIREMIIKISSGFYEEKNASAIDAMDIIIERVKKEAKEIIKSKKELDYFLKFIDGFTEFSSGEKEGIPEAFNESSFKLLTQESVPGQIGIITSGAESSECLSKSLDERFNFEDLGLCYNLKSIICHQGSDKSGHFAIFVFGKRKNEENAKWFFISDNVIDEVGNYKSVLDEMMTRNFQPSCFIYEIEDSSLSGINEFELYALKD